MAIAYKNFFYIFLYQQVSKIETTILGHNAEPILILSEYLQLFALRNFQLRRIYLMGTIPMQQKLGATQAFEITMEKICCCPLYLEVKYMLCPLPHFQNTCLSCTPVSNHDTFQQIVFSWTFISHFSIFHEYNVYKQFQH